MLNGLNPGEKRPVKLVVRNTARKAFEVDRMEPARSTDIDLRFQRPKAAKMIQMIPVTVQAPEKAGRFNEEYYVWIKDRDKPLKIQVTGDVVTRLGASR